MEAYLEVLNRSNAVWVFLLGEGFAIAVLLYGSHVDAQLAQLALQGNPLAGAADALQAAFREHYGNAALCIMGSASLRAWKVFRRDGKRILGY